MIAEKKIKYLIVDTSAFINNTQLHEIAENIITTNDVINEIKNKRQIRRLAVLPYDLKVEDPSPECVKHVSEFAKKTGDFMSLSMADINVIALTYQYEKEHVGSAHLRNVPVKSILVVNTGGQPTENVVSKDAFFPSTIVQEKQTVEADNLNLKTLNVKDQDQDSKILNGDNETNSNKDDNADDDKDDSEDENEDDEEDEEDDDSNWITPSNIMAVKRELDKTVLDDEVAIVGCLSSDFALQNVLKQMNIKTIALNGKVIKQMRTYILRCYACFHTTSIATKEFCPKCGHKTLKKVGTSLDENGQQIIHVNARRPITCKGKNKNLRSFTGGKHSNNPQLFEDQPTPKQMPSRVARTKTNAMDDDYDAGSSPFATRDVYSKSAMLKASKHTMGRK